MMYQLCYRIKNTKTSTTESEWEEACMFPKSDKNIVRLAAKNHGCWRLSNTLIRHAFVKVISE